MQSTKNSDLVKDIANIDNLMLAWRKLEGEISRLDDWCDIMEFYAYKFQLKDKLLELHEKLENGTYQMQPIRPLPFPKGPSIHDDGKFEPRVRQYFHIAIEDQLVWIAYCNIIAQYVEQRMPGWSFGNRTDVRVWYKDVDGKRELQVGNYRNTKNRIYKKWEHSWPRYRKLLSLTIKRMCENGKFRRKIEELTEEELQMLSDNERYPEQKLDYLDNGYFGQMESESLYWAGIDIERFYPSIDRKLISENLAKIIYKERQTSEFWRITNTLLDFKIDVTGFTPEELADLKLEANGTYNKGLPTGLLMAGFLSNLGLLGIDNQVKQWLSENHKIAHFRYVDDHVILSQDKHALVEWVKKYEELLENKGFTINRDKIEPKSLSDILDGDEEKDLKGIDPAYPSPLMTLMLQKVSQMADMNVEQLSNTEFDLLFADLKELLVMDISDQEIKKETRISFAVTMLSRILVRGDIDYEELGRLKQELRKELEEKGLLHKKDWLEWFYRDDEYPNLPVSEKLKKKMGLIEDKYQRINQLLQDAKANRERKHQDIFNLIEKALEDVPERTRIWIRMIQFCYKHMPECLVKVYTLLDSPAIMKKMHHLDIIYLRMMLLNKLAQLIMKDMSCKEYEIRFKTARARLMEILNNVERVPEHEKYFERETFYFIDHVLKLEHLINNRAMIDINTEILYFGDNVDVDFWILYYLNHVNSSDKEQKDRVIQIAIPSIITNSCYYPVLFLKCMSCPSFQEETLKEASLDLKLIGYVKKHHLEIDVYRTFKKKFRKMIASLFEMDTIEKTKSNYITLSEWIFALSAYDEGSLYHTEHLEYIALKVTKSIIKTLEINYSNLLPLFPKQDINLFNICIKKECQEQIGDYDYWDQVDDFTTYEPTACPASIFPFDYKLFPNEYSDVYDIGVILLQMLTLDHLPSDYLVDDEYGYKWEGIIMGLMQHGYMSFYTYMILMACLSKRNRETMNFVKSGMADIRRDDELDPPIISNLNELLAHVEQSLRLMKENRVSLPNQKYRTLSIVSLDNYRAFEKKVKDKNEDNHDLKDFLKVDIIQTNMDARQAWSGLKSKSYNITDSEMQKCWLEIVLYFKQIMDMDKEVRPQLVILPEFAFDKSYYQQLKMLSDKSGCLVIAGRNFIEAPGKRIMNKAVVFVPYKWPNGRGYTSTPDFEFGKYFFARIEEDFIKKIGFKPQPYDKMYVVDAGQYGKMGLAICADFYDIERFTVYRGRIQHLFIIAYNKDVKSFYYLAEAISRIVFCNVVICNTGFYGGSIAFAPYKDDYKRYVYKHEGGNLYTNQIVLLPVASLYQAQTGKDDDKFKACPPGYSYKGIGLNKEQ